MYGFDLLMRDNVAQESHLFLIKSTLFEINVKEMLL